MLALSLASLPLPASAQGGSFPAPERKKIQEMLDGVRKAVVENYYDSTFAGVNLAAAYDSASAHISNAAGVNGALGAVAWFALTLHDSHTIFAPPPTTVHVDYGWNMAMFGDSCFVVAVKKESDAARQGVHVGDQVLSVAGYAPTRDNLWQVNYLFRVLRPQPALQATLRAPNGDTREMDLKAKVSQHGVLIDISGADGGRDIGQLIREGEKDAERVRGFSIELGDEAIVWKMPTFAMGYDDIYDVLKRARKRKALVLDLRGNSGGYVKTMLELAKQMHRDSLVVGTLRGRRKTSQLVAKGAGGDAFTGQLYILVDDRSASASEIFARAMQLAGRAKIIGDRTAGAVMESLYHPRSIGMETKMFYGVSVTEADVIMSDGGRLERVGVTPDERLLPTSADLAAHRDPVLARAITLAGVPITAEKAGSLYPDKTDQ
ncbi:MAG: S41 family peptidase [Gemmatimonadaceae bacterium]